MFFSLSHSARTKTGEEVKRTAAAVVAGSGLTATDPDQDTPRVDVPSLLSLLASMGMGHCVDCLMTLTGMLVSKGGTKPGSLMCRR